MTTRAVETWTLEPLVKFVKEAGARLVLVMTSAGQVPIAPYVVFSGQRFVNGRARAGAVWARTFHEVPVPPDFPAEESGPRPRRNAEMPSRLSGLLGAPMLTVTALAP